MNLIERCEYISAQLIELHTEINIIVDDWNSDDRSFEERIGWIDETYTACAAQQLDRFVSEVKSNPELASKINSRSFQERISWSDDSLNLVNEIVSE